VFNHAANALQVPAVIMFGSTSPTGSGYKDHVNLASGDSCQPCYREDNTIAVHKKPACPYAHKCMVDYMSVDRVEQAIRNMLTAR
jgi:ADP-heptose:LPS heptosyltransferase